MENDNTQLDALLRDLLDARGDLGTLASAHSITLCDLAQWASDENNFHLLDGICRLADMQAQVLMSRYRLAATGRLIQMATEQEPSELSRKACVDLLKLDVRPTDKRHVVDEAEDDDTSLDVTSLRRFLYDDSDDQNEPAGES